MLASRIIVEAVDDATDRKAEELINLPHPVGIAAGQVVIDGDHVDAAPRQCIQVDRQGGDQRLAFAGLHLRDLALVQDDAALKLHIVWALA